MSSCEEDRLQIVILILVGLGSIHRLSIRHGAVLRERPCILFAQYSNGHGLHTFTYHSGRYPLMDTTSLRSLRDFRTSRQGQKRMYFLENKEKTKNVPSSPSSSFVLCPSRRQSRRRPSSVRPFVVRPVVVVVRRPSSARRRPSCQRHVVYVG